MRTRFRYFVVVEWFVARGEKNSTFFETRMFEKFFLRKIVVKTVMIYRNEIAA